MNTPKDLKDIPILRDPRVQVEVTYLEKVKVIYPPEMREEMVQTLWDNGFCCFGGGYSGPVSNLCKEYIPGVSQRKEITAREILIDDEQKIHTPQGQPCPLAAGGS